MALPTIPPELRELLDREAETTNRPEFVNADPVQFPRRFTDQRDIEIAALLSATIAWGNRTMICRDCNRMLYVMQGEPYRFTMEGDLDALDPRGNVHRTFFNENLAHYLRGLRRVYSRHTTLEDFAAATGAPHAESPAWHLAGALSAELTEANRGEADGRCLPQRLDTTALKRFNMALRWLVRDDGIVDIGVWKAIQPSQLFIPLDVHVANTSRSLGLLERRSNDRKAVEMLTEALRSLRPHDPVVYDFALFGIGIKRNSQNNG